MTLTSSVRPFLPMAPVLAMLGLSPKGLPHSHPTHETLGLFGLELLLHQSRMLLQRGVVGLPPSVRLVDRLDLAPTSFPDENRRRPG